MKNKSHKKILNKRGPKIVPYGTPNKASSHDLNSEFVLVLNLANKNHGGGSRKLWTGQWEKLPLLATADFHFTNIVNRQCKALNPFQKPHWYFDKIDSKYSDICLNINISYILEILQVYNHL